MRRLTAAWRRRAQAENRHGLKFAAMPSRRRHYVSHLVDRDILHVGGVTLAACVLSAGLLYAGYFVHTFRVARNAPCTPRDGRCLLLFGKHAPGGMIDGDFDE